MIDQDGSTMATGTPVGSSATILPKTPIVPKRKPGRKPKSHSKELLTVLSSVSSAVRDFLSQKDLHLLPSQSLSLESLLSSLPFPPSPSPSPAPSSDQSFFSRFHSSVPDFDPRWVDNFRMTKHTFNRLLCILCPSLLTSLPPSIPPESAVAAALFRLAHAAPYEAVARIFGLDSYQAACLAFYSVCKVVNEKLADFVDFGGDMERIRSGFEWLSLPNCCGVLGFGKFGVESELVGKNGSLLVQALVDCEGRFLDISGGWPCTMRPESILTNTKLYNRIEKTKELLNGKYYNLNNGISIPQYIMGGSCLPMLPWLITPYIGGDNLNSAEKEFNICHRKAMQLAESAFIRLKAQWRLLAMRWKGDTGSFLPFVIVMGCLLHNYLIKSDEQPPGEHVEWNTQEEELPVYTGEADERGAMIRHVIAQILMNNKQ
ncbi:protein ALP1-like [Euphorbia lathyris]|uniref:protein ALP1-like n=1 Tax=Euphorbia lathyris TaxID=212925 RepID=UPI0033131321